MDHCPNCGSAVAPTAPACPACRLPRPRGLSEANSGQGVGPHGLFRPDQPDGPVDQADLVDTTGGPGSGGPYSVGPTDPDRTHVSQSPVAYRPDQQPTIPAAAAWVPEPNRPGSGPPPPQRPAPPPVGPSPFEDPAESDRRRQRRTVIGIVTGALTVAVLLGVGVALAINTTGGRDTQPTVPSDVPVPPPASTPYSVPAPTDEPSSSTAPSESTPPSEQPTASPPSESSSASESPQALPEGSTDCEEGKVAVPEKGTSCAFASEVAKAVAASTSTERSFPVEARSPVTKKDYTMTCTRDGRLVTCTGGAGAVVYVLEEQ